MDLHEPVRGERRELGLLIAEDVRLDDDGNACGERRPGQREDECEGRRAEAAGRFDALRAEGVVERLLDLVLRDQRQPK
jgi:hypothetical protein